MQKRSIHGRAGRYLVLAALALPWLSACSDATGARRVRGLSGVLTPPDDGSGSTFCGEPSLTARRTADGSTVGYASVTAGQKYTYNANGAGCAVGSWSADNAAVSISGSGNQVTLQVKALISSFTLTVYSGGTPFTYTIAVGAPTVVFDNTASISVGTTASLSFAVFEAGGYRILPAYWPAGTPVFTSANTAIATVVEGSRTSTGTTAVVTGRGGGSTTVQGSFVGVTKTAYVTVTAPAASVTLNTSGMPMIIGQTFQLTATVKDAAGNVINRSVAWTSSNPAAATVSGSGLVTAVADGSADVAATVDGVSATAHFSVAGCRDCNGGNTGTPPIEPLP